MIQPLRARHYRSFLALAIVLPLLFVAGLRARHQQATPDTPKSVSASGQLMERAGDSFRIRLRVAPGTTRRIMIEAGSYALVPDVLVYWSPDRVASDLPGSAALLGPFRAGAEYQAPAAGTLVFYSLADRRLVANVALGDTP